MTMYRNQRFISCCLMAAWVGGMVSLSACGETSVDQPAAMALGRHAVVNGVADTLVRFLGEGQTAMSSPYPTMRL